MSHVLFLGSPDSPLVGFLQEQGETVYSTENLSLSAQELSRFDFLVSYGYRHILKKDVLSLFPNSAINLHISYLPWNRGADPNFWSFVENTPKGVTIHLLDEGVDTGEILAQREVTFSGSETLKSSYEILQREIQSLFREKWQSIKAGSCVRSRQDGKGSVHRKKDMEKVSHLLTQGWDTPIKSLMTASKELTRS
jgi:methionyl-tRNA formyltransferase